MMPKKTIVEELSFFSLSYQSEVGNVKRVYSAFSSYNKYICSVLSDKRHTHGKFINKCSASRIKRCF